MTLTAQPSPFPVDSAAEPDSSGLAPERMVDLQRYPIADPGSDAGAQFVRRCRSAYAETGLCALPEFVLPPARRALSAQANAVSAAAFFCRSSHNAYLTEADTALADDHVRRRQEQTYVGSVAYDRIGENSDLQRLYLWDPLKDFIGAVLGKPKLHRFADPLGACSINVFVDGGEHGWTFDESEFTVTLMLQAPATGGAFEYVPMIRGTADEQGIVERVLDGDRSNVVELPFSPGTLLIFGGRQTLHRVTRVTGQRPRLVPVLCYSEQPDQHNSDAVRQLFWGRTGTDVGQPV